MTKEIFEVWIDGFNLKMRAQSRTVALILDNCSGHIVASRSNVQLFFLPPNTTAVSQPLDAGVIKVFKDRFYAQMQNDILKSIDDIVDADDYSRRLTVYEAAIWTRQSFQDMPLEHIKNCFSRCHISAEAADKKFV